MKVIKINSTVFTAFKISKVDNLAKMIVIWAYEPKLINAYHLPSPLEWQFMQEKGIGLMLGL